MLQLQLRSAFEPPDTAPTQQTEPLRCAGSPVEAGSRLRTVVTPDAVPPATPVARRRQRRCDRSVYRWLQCVRASSGLRWQVNPFVLQLLSLFIPKLCAEHTYVIWPISDLHVCAWCLYVWGSPPSFFFFFFPKGKVSCSFSNSSWYRVNCNQLAGGLVQSKHLERGDCTGRYPGGCASCVASPLLPLSSMPPSCVASLKLPDCRPCSRPTMVRLPGLILRFAPPAPPTVVWPVSQSETSQTGTF